MDVEQNLEREFTQQVALDDEGPEYLITEEYNYEFDRQNLEFQYKLGEGQFGCVYKAEATNIAGFVGKSTVAVKLLKGTFSKWFVTL